MNQTFVNIVYGINIPVIISTVGNRKERNELFSRLLRLLAQEPGQGGIDQCYQTDAITFKKRPQIRGLRPWGADTLAAGLSGVAKSVIIEPNYICKDHSNLYSEYLSKKFSRHRKITTRLHFFDKPLSMEGQEVVDILEDLSGEDSYLGYSVIRDHDRSLGRSVFDPRKVRPLDAENCHFLATEFRAQVNGVPFKVKGFPYMSQDGELIRCAHVSLWGIVRYLSQAHQQYAEIYPFDTVRLSTDHRRTFPNEGLTFEGAASVLKGSGANPHVGTCKTDSKAKTIDEEGIRKIYAYIESGVPVLVTVPGHAFTVVGHTLDLSRVDQIIEGTRPSFSIPRDEKKDLELFDSSSFVPAFIVVDDNYFPYRTLSKGRFKEDGNELSPFKSQRDLDLAVKKLGDDAQRRHDCQFSLDSVRTFICPLPEKVFSTAPVARKALKAVMKEFAGSVEEEKLIFRLFFSSSNAYKRFKRSQKGTASYDSILDDLTCSLSMPHYVWICELATVDQYKNRMVMGEFVFDATNKDEESSLLFVRLEKYLHFHSVHGKSRKKCGSIRAYKNFVHNLK